MAVSDYDPRYLAGILLFNRGDYFEAHDVWEEQWAACDSPERAFYQGLIQAAVALLHFGNGNLRGAAKLFESSRGYMAAYQGRYLGLDLAAFWEGMGRCLAAVRAGDASAEFRLEDAPEIVLEPAPLGWPKPEEFLLREER